MGHVLAVMVFSISLQTPVQVVYVDRDAPGNNTGTSWEHAYRNLYDVLGPRIDDPVEIRVAEGTYAPPAEMANFNLWIDVNRADILGGFGGFLHDDPDHRDPKMHPTILTGDFLGDDNGFFNQGENATHVIRAHHADDYVLFDGFTIRGGRAAVPGFENEKGYGGGVYAETADITFIDCTFTYNVAREGGGGILCLAADLRLEGCLFFKNLALRDHGGGVQMGRGREEFPLLQAVVINCVFIGNFSGRDGGGMWLNRRAVPYIVHCTFVQNEACQRGGGIGADGLLPPRPSIFGSIFWDNSAENQGNGTWWYQIDVNGQNQQWAEHCLIKGGYPYGEYLLDEDPKFVDLLGPDGLPGTGDENLRLLPDSPCIDAGTNIRAEEWPTLFDLDGNPRFLDVPAVLNTGYGVCPQIDMGAYEAFGEECCTILGDMPTIVDCLAGPGANPNPSGPFSLIDCILEFDVDQDEDVDLEDYVLMEVRPACP